MQALFTRGADSNALSLFLANKPGEHGLKQAARAIDVALSSAHNRTCVPLASHLQSITFLLDELGGLLASSAAYDGLGIKVCPLCTASLPPTRSSRTTHALTVDNMRRPRRFRP